MAEEYSELKELQAVILDMDTRLNMVEGLLLNTQEQVLTSLKREAKILRTVADLTDIIIQMQGKE